MKMAAQVALFAEKNAGAEGWRGDSGSSQQQRRGKER